MNKAVLRWAAALILLGYSLIIVPTGFVSVEFAAARQEREQAHSRTCPSCMAEGHDLDARFCKRCGGPLALD